MATTTKTFTFNSSLENWVGTAGSADVTMSRSTSDGSPDTGCLSARVYGKNKNPAASTWEWTGTLADLGVPAGATVSAIGYGSNNDYNWRCSEYTTGYANANYIGAFELWVGGSLVGTFRSALSAVSAATSWATENGAAISGLNYADTQTITLRFSIILLTGSSNSAAVTMLIDQVVLEVEYAASTIVQLGGTVAGSSLVAGSLKRYVEVTGSTDGVAVVAGTLKAYKELQAQAAGSSLVVGDLSLKTVAVLQGTVAGQSIVAGDLGYGSVSLDFSGTSGGQSVVVGGLIIRKVLSGQSGGVSAVGGSLVKIVLMTAQSIGSSVIAATLKVVELLAGTSAGSSVNAAYLHLVRLITGTSGGVSTVSGTLTDAAADGYEGSVSGSSSVSGTLVLVKRMTTQAAGVSVVEGGLVVVKSLNGATAGQSSVAGQVGLIKGLSGEVVGISSVAGSLSIQGGGLEGVSNGSSSVAGTLVIVGVFINIVFKSHVASAVVKKGSLPEPVAYSPINDGVIKKSPIE